MTDDRRAALAANLAEFRARLADVCSACDRDPAQITLIAVTKTFPASDVRLLADLGVTDVGENRDQEATAKHEAVADSRLRWHFVGGLQRNKARSVVRYADMVHSVDRGPLVEALSAAADAVDRRVTALVQVSVDPEGEPTGRSGAPPDAVLSLADAIAAAPGLQLGGVMAVAPLGGNADQAFARLADVAASVRAAYPAATVVSAGMSGDFESALRHGATHLRIGTALLGRRSGSVG